MAGEKNEQLTWTAELNTSMIIGIVESIGLKSTWDRFQRARDNAELNRGCGNSFVHSTSCQLAISCVILIHSLLTGYSADVALKVEVFQGPQRAWLDVVEIIFSVFFFLELLARVSVERVAFLIGQDWKWNMFDTLLVMVSVFDMTSAGHPSAGQGNSANVARILRMFRFCRLLRISRVMKQLSSLRLIMFAIMDSMSSLVWCFVFIAFTMYIFAVLVVYGVAEYFRGGDIDPAAAADMKEWWGGLYRAMVTFFMVITGGADWGDPMRSLMFIHPIYEPLFIFYIFFMVFGVLNVVVGAFVATSSQIAADDREAVVKYETERLSRYTERIKGFFKEADLDQSGTLSWEEFSTHLNDPKVKAYFQSLELDVSQAHILFELLDADGSNQVTVDEFLDGCLRLKGQARSIDLNMLLFMSRKVFAAILDIIQRPPAAGRPTSA